MTLVIKLNFHPNNNRFQSILDMNYSMTDIENITDSDKVIDFRKNNESKKSNFR